MSDQNKGSGPQIVNVTSHNQTGGITAQTVHIGRQEFVLTDQHIQQVLREVTPGQAVALQSVGNQRAQAMGSALYEALSQAGFSVNWTQIGMMAPPPDGPLTVIRSPTGSTVTIAPNF